MQGIRKHPSAYFQGCKHFPLTQFICQGCQRSDKDKERQTWTAFTPNGLPILRSSQLRCVMQRCRDIVKLFHNNQTFHARLSAGQKKIGDQGCVCPAPTLWVSIKGCYKALLMSERILQGIVSAWDYISGIAAQEVVLTQLRAMIKSDNFVALLEE